MEPWEPEHPELPPKALAALRSGRKIEAIRIVRAETGLDLTDAKAVVDAAEARLGLSRAPRPSHGFDLQPGKEDSGTLRLLAVLALLGAIAAALFIFFEV